MAKLIVGQYMKKMSVSTNFYTVYYIATGLYLE